MKTLAIATLLFGGALMPQCLRAQRLSADGAAQTLNLRSERFFTDVLFKFSPTAGTSAGLHEYDPLLEDYSAAGVAREVAALHAAEKQIAEIPSDGLDASQAADREILLANIRSGLLSLEVIRSWEKDPDTYSSGIASSAFTIMSRKYAPADVRLKAVVAREVSMPQVLQEARRNLKNPPRIYTEIALQQIEGNISFFQNDLPAAFVEAKDGATRAAFERSNAAVIEALKSYGAWLRTDLLPRSQGDFRYGADTFAKKLLYDEMVDIPLDRLLKIAYADLHKNQAEFARVAQAIDPTKTPQEVLAELATIHPPPEQLLGTFQAQFAGLIGFIQGHHIIRIPSTVEPTLEETPPFMRATTQASMDPPGPFETHSTQAYFNVTLPEKGWSPERVAEHMAAFNVGTITSTAIHEAYPGHYVQFLYLPQFPSKIRKLLGTNSNIEGWAHYCEQMMLDEGYLPALTGSPEEQAKQAKLIRLGQLQDALLRDARYIVAIRMHTRVGGALSIEEAEKLFVTEGYQSPAIGSMETKRGTSNATYLYYTLGKLEILKLRADVQAKQGAAFSLEGFHTEFMRQGTIPIKLIRRAMLHDDSPVL